MKNRILLGLMVLFFAFTFAAKANVARADEYDEYGYQFSPGYADAMQQDPTFGGRQAENPVINPDPLPPPPAPEEGSPAYNFTPMECWDTGFCYPC